MLNLPSRRKLVTNRRTAFFAAFLVLLAILLSVRSQLRKGNIGRTLIFSQAISGSLIPAHEDVGSDEAICPIALPTPGFLDDALHNITRLLPDRAGRDRLLSPIDGSEGTSMLHDLADRARFFQNFFAAWESLHTTATASPGYVLLRANIPVDIWKASLAGSDEAIRVYDEVRCFMNKLTHRLFPWTMAYFADHMLMHAALHAGGRGIVMTVGEREVAYALTSIRTMRELGCDLRVEIFYIGDGDLSSNSRAVLSRHTGVVTRDLSQMIYDDGWELKGWAAKPMAMLLSSFREAILIDADVLFFVDPTTLLLDQGYLKSGALFFRDRLLAPRDRAAFITRSLPPPLSSNVLRSNRWWSGTSSHMQESGVVIVDKWRHFVALLLATRLNGPDRHGDSTGQKKGVYEMMHGDKETFWLSWEMAGDIDYTFYDGRAGQIGSITQTKSEDGIGSGEEMCGKQLLHTSREGRPLWFNGWIATDKHGKDHLKDFQVFRGFVTEPRETAREDSHYWNGWQVREGNVMCLAGDDYQPLSAEEERTVSMIIGIAKDVIASDI